MHARQGVIAHRVPRKPGAVQTARAAAEGDALARRQENRLKALGCLAAPQRPLPPKRGRCFHPALRSPSGVSVMPHSIVNFSRLAASLIFNDDGA